MTTLDGKLFQKIKIFGIPGLFTNECVGDRFALKLEGLFVYDLRGSDVDPNFPIQVERRVWINHAGTVITCRPLNLGNGGYRHFTEEDGLNFTDGYSTISEFLKEEKEMGSKLTTFSDIVLDTVDRIGNGRRVESSAQRRIPLFHCLPMCIKRRGTATIVEWCDGTVTKIVRQKDAPGNYSIFEAFCVAYAKKMFGSKSTLERVIRDADEQTQLKHRADMEAHHKKLREEENTRKARKRAKQKQQKEVTYHE